MKKTKSIIGYLFIFGGVILGLYVGIWSMFIAPIVECCNAFDAGTLTGLMIGTTIVKCFLSGTVGYLIMYISCKIGLKLVD